MIKNKVFIFSIITFLISSAIFAQEEGKNKELQRLQQKYIEARKNGDEFEIKKIIKRIVVDRNLVREILENKPETIYETENYENDIVNFFNLVNQENYTELEKIVDNIKEKSLINAKNKYGSNALMVAIGKANLKIVQLLLENGADVNAQNNYGKTPFEFALYIKDPIIRDEIIHELVSNPNFNPNLKNQFGLTLLMLAMGLKDNLEIIKKLIDLKVDLNAKDNNNNTPLYYAVYLNNFLAVKLLIKNGADIWVKGKFTDFVKGIPKEFKKPSYEIFKFFEDYAKKINELIDAAARGDLKLVQELLKEVNINSKNEYGLTALDVAEKNGQKEMVKFLSKQIQR